MAKRIGSLSNSKNKIYQNVAGVACARQRAVSPAFTLVEIMIVVLIIGLLLAIALPNFARSREAASQKACIGNLRKLQWAKDAYLMDKSLSGNYIFSTDGNEIYGTTKYIKYKPVCPSIGQDYTLGTGDSDPICNYSNTSFPHLLVVPTSGS